MKKTDREKTAEEIKQEAKEELERIQRAKAAGDYPPPRGGPRPS